MHLKMSSGKWRPFCLGLNVLMLRYDGLITKRTFTRSTTVLCLFCRNTGSKWLYNILYIWPRVFTSVKFEWKWKYFLSRKNWKMSTVTNATMFVQLQYGNEVELLYSTSTGSLFDRLWARFSLLFGGNFALQPEISKYNFQTHSTA